MPKKSSSVKPKLTPDERNLIKRYLLWCYKTTKEELERIDRKFTQLIVDDFILKEITSGKNIKDGTLLKGYVREIKEFEVYIEKKRQEALNQKYSDTSKGAPDPHYFHLKRRLTAIEKAICRFFTPKTLSEIKALYQREMTKRILEAREH